MNWNLELAIINRDILEVNEFILRGANPSHLDENGESMLMRTVDYHFLEATKSLLKTNQSQPGYVWRDMTALDMAIMDHAYTIVSLILKEAGPFSMPNRIDLNGLTPFMRASQQNNTQTVKALLRSGLVNPDQYHHRMGVKVGAANVEREIAINRLIERRAVIPRVKDEETEWMGWCRTLGNRNQEKLLELVQLDV